MPRPKSDLTGLQLPKDGDDVTSSASTNEPAGKGYAHTLSLRLTSEQYRRLRRYVAEQEDKTGRRATHQSIIENALSEFLNRNM